MPEVPRETCLVARCKSQIRKARMPNGHHVTAEASPEANAYDWNIWSKETAAEMRNKKERNTEASEPGPGVWFSLRK